MKWNRQIRRRTPLNNIINTRSMKSHNAMGFHFRYRTPRFTIVLVLHMNIIHVWIIFTLQPGRGWGCIRGQKAFGYSGGHVWNLILSHIETDCAIYAIRKLCTKLLLNSRNTFLQNWISIYLDSFHATMLSEHCHSMKQYNIKSFLKICKIVYAKHIC